MLLYINYLSVVCVRSGPSQGVQNRPRHLGWKHAEVWTEKLSSESSLFVLILMDPLIQALYQANPESAAFYKIQIVC